MTSVCSRAAELKAAYRLLDRDEVTHDAVTDPHGQRTRETIRQPGRFLLLEDTTELNYSGHAATTGLGRIGGARDEQGPRGLHLHTSLAVQLQPGTDVVIRRVVGLAHQVVWARTTPPTRDTRGRRASPKVRLGRPDRESQRWAAVTAHLEPPPPGTTWIVVQDREGDIYESMSRCLAKKISFVIRAQQDRVPADAGDAGDAARLFEAVAAAPVLGAVTVDLPRRGSRPSRPATLTLRAVRRPFQAPYRPGGRPAALTLTVLEAREVTPPAGADPVLWVLVTDQAVTAATAAATVLKTYAARELIEEFHKALKTGLGVEKSRLTTARRLGAVAGVLSVVATFLLDLSRRGRETPEAPLEASDRDAVLLEVLEGHRGAPRSGSWTVTEFVRAVACLGGFPGWNRRRRPGWITIWRGWQRLMAMVQGVESFARRNTGTDPPGASD